MADEKKEYFSKENKETALRWIKERCPNLKCEACNHNKWTLADDLVMSMPFTGGGLVIGGPSYPLAMLICNNCGNTKHFNAVMMKAVTGGEDDK